MLNTDNYKPKPYRPELDPQTFEELVELAKRFKCMHSNKPSIKRLLRKIALGELSVTEDPMERSRVADTSTICFYITVPRYLKGTVAILSDEIAKYRGNIRRVETSTAVKTLKERVEDHLGILHIFVHFEDEKSLTKLVSSLMSMKIKEVKNYNNRKELMSLIKVFRENGQLLGLDDEDRYNELLKLEIVQEIKCIAGFRFVVKDEIGVLASITKQIAIENILIHSINEGKHRKDNSLAIIEIFVYLRSSESVDNHQKISDISNQIAKISAIEKEFKKIKSVIKIDRIEVRSHN